MSKLVRKEIRLPGLLGMLIVGIALKNIPYNIGQFGRLECEDGAVLDTVNDLDDIDEHSSWRRKRSEDEVSRSRRSSGLLHVKNITHVLVNITDDHLSHCNPRYIGHELDPFISRSLITVSLNVILLMAGLELDPAHLKHLSAVVIRATLIPCLVEASSVAVLAHFLLGKTSSLTDVHQKSIISLCSFLFLIR